MHGHACRYRDFVELLLSHDVDPATEIDGQFPLVLASMHGHTDVAALLISKGASVGSGGGTDPTPLFMASAEGHSSVVELLLANGASPTVTCDGLTPMYMACQLGAVDVVLMLIAAGADPNELLANGAAPLHAASRSGHAEVVDVLLNRGADPSVRFGGSSNGATPLHFACSEGHLEVAELLVGCSADPNVKAGGYSPMAMAFNKGHRRIVEYLSAVGADEPDIMELKIPSREERSRRRPQRDTKGANECSPQ
jgi:ankyrin repeat protein